MSKKKIDFDGLDLDVEQFTDVKTIERVREQLAERAAEIRRLESAKSYKPKKTDRFKLFVWSGDNNYLVLAYTEDQARALIIEENGVTVTKDVMREPTVHVIPTAYHFYTGE